MPVSRYPPGAPPALATPKSRHRPSAPQRPRARALQLSYWSAMVRPGRRAPQQERHMGLLDVLNGMQNGPRGQTNPNAQGGMSPITMAILAMLAYKGIKHLSAGQQQSAPSGNP